MKKSNFNFILGMAAMVSLMISFSACDSEPVDERPDLPPIESMMMDFSDFEGQPGGAKASELSYGNFTHSYFSVVYWNLISTVAMTLPVAAYGHALQQEAEYVGDQTWEWSFDFKYEGVDYSAVLTGARMSNEKFSTEMKIGLAAQPGQGIKWFDGEVRYDHTQAIWNLYKEGTVKVLEAEWHKNFETEAGDLKYTYMEPELEETGSFIMFEHMPQEVYDASYTISLAAGTTEIEWNIASKEGHVKDETKFGDANWRCWDSHANGLADMDCQ